MAGFSYSGFYSLSFSKAKKQFRNLSHLLHIELKLDTYCCWLGFYGAGRENRRRRKFAPRGTINLAVGPARYPNQESYEENTGKVPGNTGRYWEIPRKYKENRRQKKVEWKSKSCGWPRYPNQESYKGKTRESTRKYWEILGKYWEIIWIIFFSWNNKSCGRPSQISQPEIIPGGST